MPKGWLDIMILIRPVLAQVDLEIINTGETKENLFALFILLYCVSIQFRLKNGLKASGEAA